MAASEKSLRPCAWATFLVLPCARRGETGAQQKAGVGTGRHTGEDLRVRPWGGSGVRPRERELTSSMASSAGKSLTSFLVVVVPQEWLPTATDVMPPSRLSLASAWLENGRDGKLSVGLGLVLVLVRGSRMGVVGS
eukprot:scaffold30635_cov35-Phaeocystis_antarctica.AAC.1